MHRIPDPTTVQPPSINPLPLVGISSCLAGQKVRYDGQHKFNQLIAAQIAPYVRLLQLCPEAAIGMGIPRPPIQVRQTAEGLRAVGRDNPGMDVTEPLNHFADIISRTYPELCGYIFQSRSPSCGVKTTPVYDGYGSQIDMGSGLVAKRLADNRPELPLVNDTDLLDEPAAAQFLTRVQQRYQQLSYRYTVSGKITPDRCSPSALL